MHDEKDIADLLEEVQTIVYTLRDEKTDLRDQVSGLEAQLSLVKEEKTKEGRSLQDINAQLTKELQDTKVRLERDQQVRHLRQVRSDGLARDALSKRDRNLAA